MIKTQVMKLTFETIRLKAKLNYGAELLDKLDKDIRDTDLTKDKEVEKLREYCFDIANFLKE